MKLLAVILILVPSVFTHRSTSELKCDEISGLFTNPNSLFPHVVKIMEIQFYLRIEKCYGTLISTDFVLTSGKCMGTDEVDKFRVRKVKMDNEEYNDTQEFSIERIFLSESLENQLSDIALIQLTEAIPYHEKSSIFRPACLWRETSIPTADVYSTYGIAASKDGIYPRYIDQIIPLTRYSDRNNNCSKPVYLTLNSFHDNTPEKSFCTDLKIYKANGSPIDAKIHDRYYVFGIFRSIDYSEKVYKGIKLNEYLPWIESIVWPNDTIAAQDECGQRKIKHIPLITYGLPTYRGQYPWHVALYRMQGGRNNVQTYICGGTIINNWIILTAAHCVMDERGVLPPSRLLVMAGTHNLNEATIDTVNYIVQRIIVHEEYNRHYMENDIAILKLSNAIEYSNYIQPICIYNETQFKNITWGTVAGWGHDEQNQPSSVLVQATLPIVNYTECRNSNRDFFHTYFNNMNFCAGSQNGTNVCSGDSGSSMIFENNSRWYIRGIVSIGVALPNSNQCDVTEMALFTDVPKFYDWIMSNLENN